MNADNATKTIADIYKQMFDDPHAIVAKGHGPLFNPGVDDPLALLFTVEVHMENYGFEKDGDTFHSEWIRDFYRRLEIVVTSRHQVFIKVHDQVLDDSPGEWKNTSNHPSRWKRSGLNEIYNTCDLAYKHCWSDIPEEHHTGSLFDVPVNVNSRLSNQPLMRLARVKIESGRVMEGNCSRGVLILKEVNPLEFKITVLE